MTYLYSLRYALQPGKDNKEKIDQLLTFCQEGKIDDINFFINHEEIGWGHLTYEESEQWTLFAKELKGKLKAREMSFSLNPGITLMHGDRGRLLNPNLTFETMVDESGVKAKAVACPFDPNWQEYFAKTYGIYAKVEPEYLWLEDDLRHFNHRPITWGCFCDKHMAEYEKRMGEKLERRTFVERILASGTPTLERKVYLDVCRQTILDLVEKIRIEVEKVSPQTKLALMTSQPEQHAAEGRDWLPLFEKLSGDKPFVARPHLPSYNEVTPKDYSNGFSQVSRVTAHILGDQAELYPELENYMYSRYAKSNRFSQFQLESSLVLHPKGSTMNLFDMMGTGVVLDYHLQEMLGQSKAFLSQVTDLNLLISEQQGVKVLYDLTSSYTIQTREGKFREELLPKETSWLALLSAFGISCLPSRLEELQPQDVVAISGQFLRNLNPIQIKNLFTNHAVMLDGESAAILVEEGFGEFIHAKKGQWLEVHTGYQSYEQVDNGQQYTGISEPRMSLMQQTGDFYCLDYEGEVQVITNAYNEYHVYQGPVCVKVGQHFILPIAWNNRHGWNSQYINFKEEIIKEYLGQTFKGGFAQTFDMPYCHMYHYQQANKEYFVIANFSTENYKRIRCDLPIKSGQFKEYSRQGEQLVNYENGYLLTELAYYELKVFELLI